MNGVRTLMIAVAALALAAPVAAQQVPRDRVREEAPGRRAPMERLAELVQRRLGLTGEQASRLRETTTRHAALREQLLRQERQMRRTLRAELARGEAADESRVGQLLDDLLTVQRRRLEVLTAEQRELRQFLSPVQRAEFMAMQERAFRAAQQQRAQRDGGVGRPGRPRAQ